MWMDVLLSEGELTPYYKFIVGNLLYFRFRL